MTPPKTSKKNDNARLSDSKQKLLEKYLQGRTKQDPSTRPAIPRRPDGAPVPLSLVQRQVWVHSQIAGDVPIYNEAFTIYRKGSLDAGVLERCFVEILRRHEIWRTTFDILEGEPIQVIHPAPERFSLPLHDLHRRPASERESEAIRLATEDARKSFDLQKGPLLRGLVIRTEEEEYRLYLTFHQLVFDAVSAYRVLLPELASLYEAFSAGKPSPLPELALQYGDFACWQKNTLAEDGLSDPIAFWARNLSGELPALPWPNDHARPADETHRGAIHRFQFDSGLIQPLREFCQREGVSSYMTLAAAYVAMLSRYSGQTDLIIGGISAGRNLSEVEPLGGDFVNPFALRFDLSVNLTFRELAKQARLVVLDGLANSQAPFGKVVEKLRLRPDASRNPIFQIILSQQPQLSAELPGWNLATEEVSNGASKLDLMVVIDERPDAITGPITYNPDLFEVSTITRMVEHWQTLLAAAIANPDAKISELPLLTGAECQRILVDWNATHAEYPTEACLHHLIEQQAARTPDAIAVEFAGSRLSYRELNERANQLAHHLRQMGVGRDVLVGVFVRRSLNMVVGLLGILKAGGAYLPMDPDYPKERLEYILKESEAPIVLTEENLASEVPPFAGQLIRLDADWRAIAKQGKENPAAPAEPRDLAYVLFTSGSTGKPKGVEIPHSALVNFLVSMQREPGFTAADTLLAVTTLSFDIAGLELYLPLISGGKLLIASREDAIDPACLMGLIRDGHCSVMQATPATWRALLDAGWSGSPKLKVLCGGEAFPEDIARALLTRCAELWNMYGPTETTIWSSIYRMKSVNGPIPIGRPIANTQLYVLDAHLNPVPPGTMAELYIGGAGLARGYLHRPDLTAERFIQSPFEPNARLYRTGDLARHLPDGNVECAGRVDSQVKIRGFRIELGEVEGALARCENVKQCVVIAREDTPGDKRLVGYFLAEAGATLSTGDLRAQLEHLLPNYMIPSAFVALDKLPLTPNGKIDRKALPVPEARGNEGKKDFVAPRDPLEQALARLWAKVLNVKQVGLHDNFFDLGGHSLLGVRVIVEIERLYNRRLPLATLLRAQTIADLAEVLRAKNGQSTWESLVPLRAGGSKPPFFLMHAHGGNVLEYFALANHLGSDQPVYALQSEGLDGNIRKDRTVEEMVQRYLVEMRSLQPEGPYFLGGFCFGGLLALEAARQLTAAGEEVAILAMIQTTHPDSDCFDPSLNALQRLWYKVTDRLDLERENFSHKGITYILERVRRAWDIGWSRTLIAYDAWRGISRKHLPMPYILEALTIENDKAARKYTAQPYRGEVALFRSKKQLRGLLADEYLGWKEFFQGNIDLCEVPGHQQNVVLEPQVVTLAAELSCRLHVAQSRHGIGAAAVSAPAELAGVHSK